MTLDWCPLVNSSLHTRQSQDDISLRFHSDSVLLLTTWKHLSSSCKVYSISTMPKLTWEGTEFGNFILIAFIHLWNQSIENFMSSSPLGCDFVTYLFSLREFLHNTPDEHEKICSKVSFSILQKGHEKSDSYIFLKLALISYKFKRAWKTLRAVSGSKLVMYRCIPSFEYQRCFVFLFARLFSERVRKADLLTWFFAMIFKGR